MADEKIREWIQKKLEKGIEEERIKESLKNTGHKPELVEEVKRSSNVDDNPFQKEGSQTNDTGEVFQEDDPDQDSQSKDTGKNESKKDNQKEYVDEKESEDEMFSFSSEDEEEETTERSLPDVDMPGRKTLAVVGLALLISFSMAGVFTYFDVSESFAPQCSGDEGAGVKIYSVSGQDGVTTADVRVVEDTQVVLEVFNGEEKIGQKVKQMEGRGDITVDSSGNRVSFHEYGCESPSVSRNY